MANTYLNHETGSTTTSVKLATFSAWVKRSAIGSNTCIFGHEESNSLRSAIYINDDDDFLYFQNGSNIFLTNRKFRDPSAWYHFVIQWDLTQSTAANRVKLWVNGVQETSFSTENYPAQNASDSVPNFGQQTVGANRYNNNVDILYDGYMSHVAFVDGSVVAPTVFGQTDSSSGIWKFKAPTGVTWGTNGFHLKFENSGNLGLDSSGNSNTFTVNGNGRQSLDTPSNVYATMNTINTTSNVTLTNGNTSVSLNGSYTTFGTIQVTKGKFYWEQKINGSSLFASVADGTKGSMKTVGLLNENYAWAYRSDGNKQTGGSATSWGNSFTTNDIISTALDMDNGKIWWGKNGVWQESGNPATGANAAFTGLNTSSYAPNGLTPCVGQYSGDQNTSFNFGNGYFGTTAITSAGSNGNGSLFEYDVPSGYYALNTKNINTYG
jgi:hypothetical protein